MSLREILVIREKDRFSQILSERGFKVTNFPTVETEPLEDLSELDGLFSEIDAYDGIFLTSAKAAEIILAKFSERREKFHGKFYVLGKRSFELLVGAKYSPFFIEQAKTAEEMLALIPETELKGKRFLFPRGNLSLRVIPERLKGIAELREVMVYKTSATKTDPAQSDKILEKLKTGVYAAVCFFSPSGVESFLEKSGGGFEPGGTKIAVIGKTTAGAAATRDLPVDFVSATPSAEDFAAGLIDYLKTKGN